jgi:alanine-glyoxylate transaminase/serine-glyoxylate transaminase/serine-pyruvate transaminase
MNEIHLMAAINGAEMAMLDCGVKVQPGSGAAAAGHYWRTHEAPSGLCAMPKPQEAQSNTPRSSPALTTR